MVDAILAATLIKATLDTGNLIKLGIEFWSKLKRTPNEPELDNMIQEAENQTQSSMAASGQIKLTVAVPSDEMGVLIEQMRSIREKWIATYHEPGMSAFDKQQQVDRLQREYCWYMNEMKRFNAGKLPDPHEQLWVSTSCSNYKFASL